ncbi:MAG: class I SAM-dependent methyltransferase [Nitrospirales bacterium]|nr:class I SAM-dependent methyltransferase [Nitrospirales bacterium]
MLTELSRILPLPIRKQAYRLIIKIVRQHELESAKKLEEKLPKMDLTKEHIKNLKILTNKAALLDVLPKHSVAAEIGVSRGDYSEKILSIVQPQQLHLIDSWGSEPYQVKTVIEEKFHKEIQSGQVLICQGISTTELEKKDDGIFDWVYIDTDHSYETTAKELEICRKKVKKGGIIAGHDYVTGAWMSNRRYGVVEAVNEFCIKYNWEMIYLTIEHHRHLSYAIREISS